MLSITRRGRIRYLIKLFHKFIEFGLLESDLKGDSMVITNTEIGFLPTARDLGMGGFLYEVSAFAARGSGYCECGEESGED